MIFWGGYMYLESVITTNDVDAEDAFIIIKLFQSLGAGCGRKTRFDVYVSETTDLRMTVNCTSAYKWFVFLRLIKSPNK